MLVFDHISLDKLLAKTEESFLNSGISSPKMEAWWLFKEILPQWNGLKGSNIFLSETEHQKISVAVQRRLNREPLAYIAGQKGFWKGDFKVNPSTLIPRDDSEALIELFLEIVSDKKLPATILDLGTGTGCLLLSLLGEYPHFCGIGSDIVPGAVALAKANAEHLGLFNRVDFIVANWGEGIDRKFDFIISNPPYIKTGDLGTLMPEVAEFEPKSALDGGTDGLDCYRIIIEKSKKLLLPGGKLFFEVGEGQAGEVQQIAEKSNFVFAGRKSDLAGKERAIAFVMASE